MEYELTDGGTCRKTMLIKIPAAEVNEALDKSYQDINEYVRIKGFRKGKAPRKALENRYQAEAVAEARQAMTKKYLEEVVEKESLQLMGDITVKDPGAKPAADTPFQLTLEVDVAPTFEVPEYKGIDVAAQPVDVSDADVDESLERYRRMFATYEPVEDAIREGDVLKVDFVARVDDEEIMSMKEQRLRVEGEVLFGLPCPDLVQKFSGAKAGDVVNLGVTLPADHTNPELRGREAQVAVTIEAVERGQLPEIDDAFAEGLGMGNLATFRERVKANLVREAMMQARQKEEDEIIDTLLGAVPYDVPERLVKSETDALVDQQGMRLSRAGVTPGEAMNAQLEKYRPEAAKLALKKVRWGVMSQKIAEKEGITVTNDDLAAQVEALAQTYNTSPAKIIQRIREYDGVGPMMAEILSIKVVQFILDNAKGRESKSGGNYGDTEAANADAINSVLGDHGEGEGCSCGHDHSHDH